MQLLYNLGIWIYGLSIRLAATAGNAKAQAWVSGRKNWQDQLERALEGKAGPRLWMHSASLGEFEQGRPLLEAWREQFPEWTIVLSFFSPSGYEIRKNYPGADVVCYMPLDTPAQARAFLDILEPKTVIFVKYEFWLNHLSQIRQRNIPLFLIAGLFRPDQIFFRWYGSFFRKGLKAFQHFFVQDQSSADLLQKIQSGDQCTVTGDPRVDRVASLAKEKRTWPLIRAFAEQQQVLVCGSTWPEDEAILLPFFKKLPAGWKVMIAPHEMHETHLSKLQKDLGDSALRFTQTSSGESAAAARFLIIDTIGMLGGLYAYGKLAYIGGGFGKGIHNTLEPMAHGLPVIFGPNYRKFTEALAMVQAGGAASVTSTNQLEEIFSKFSRPEHYSNAQITVNEYINTNIGATQKSINVIQKLI